MVGVGVGVDVFVLGRLSATPFPPRRLSVLLLLLLLLPLLLLPLLLLPLLLLPLMMMMILNFVLGFSVDFTGNGPL